MATKIVTKNSSTAGAAPTATDLVQGELAVNVADKRLYTEDNAGAIVELGTNPTTLNVNGTASVSASNAKIRLFETDTTDLNTQLQNQAGDFSISRLDDDAGSLTAHFNIDHATGNVSIPSGNLDVTGKVGIGTSTPAEPLHVQEGSSGITQRAGTVALIEGSGNTKVTVASGATSTGELLFGRSTDNDAGRIVYDHNDNSLAFSVSSSERLRIDSSGRVGIGESDPSGYWGQANQLVIEDGNCGLTLKSAVSGNGRLVFTDTKSTTAGLNDGGMISYGHADDAMVVQTAGDERMRIDSSGNLLVGKSAFDDGATKGFTHYSGGGDSATFSTRSSNPPLNLNRLTSDGEILRIRKDGTTVGSWKSRSGLVSSLVLDPRSTNSGCGIGTTDGLAIVSTDNTGALVDSGKDLGQSGVRWRDLYLSGVATIGTNGSEYANNYIRFKSGGAAFVDHLTVGQPINFRLSNASGLDTTAMTLTSAGSLLVGKSTTAFGTVGIRLEGPNGKIEATRNNNIVMDLNRLSGDGAIANFSKDGLSVGTIGTASGYPYLQSQGSAGLTMFTYIQPRWNNAAADNAIDLGSGSFRFDDVFATNGTIQTSDRNEKQDIAELSDAEQRVAVACKGLLRKFRWKDSVAEKGDEARTHFGIIAQDLQAAFEAEGLDAGDYAMFISTTWTDEETNEEKTRMGVRYSELLAFIIAAL